MHPRHQRLLDLLAAGTLNRVNQLATALNVTAATVRRDLQHLEGDGLVERTHGGAALSAASRIEFRFRRRAEVQAQAKQAIARAALACIQPGMTLALDTGTTTLAVARAMLGQRDLRVVTTSLAAAAVLHADPAITLVLLGGQVRSQEPDLSGELVEENLARFHVDLAILGCDGATEAGLWTADPAIARTSRAMLRGADRGLLVADHTKFGRPGFYRFATWDEIGAVVSDAGLAEAVLPWLADLPALTLAPRST